MPFRAALLVAFLAIAGALAPAPAWAADKPNIVMVVVDGLGDLATPLGGADAILPDPEYRARLTPNLERLAMLGATFTCAQAVDTLEPPEVLSLGRDGDSVALLLKAAGYTTAGTGLPKDAEEGWDEVRTYEQKAEKPHRIDGGPKNVELNLGWPIPTWGRLVPIDKRRKDDLSIEAWEGLTESLDDQLAAAWAAEQVRTKGTDTPPQFVYVELLGPAVPYRGFVAPGVFFDRFPLDQIKVPPFDPGDLKDLPEGHWKKGHASSSLSDDDRLAVIQAYLATVSAADYAIGKVVDAVEELNSDEVESNDWTLVVVSKRGTPLGQKGVWAFSPWEAATNANLMIYAPQITTAEQRVTTPVGIGSVAPTVATLAGVESPRPTGDNLMSLLPIKEHLPGVVALTTVGERALSVRSHRFRLVRYDDGGEELYDHDHDGEELYNLLHPSQAAKVKLFGMSETQVEAVKQWLSQRLDEALAQRAEPGYPSAIDDLLPGDFNNDGRVDAADSTVWRDNLGKEVPVGAAGDGDFDGRVEQDDRPIWLDNYGRKREPAPVE